MCTVMSMTSFVDRGEHQSSLELCLPPIAAPADWGVDDLNTLLSVPRSCHQQYTALHAPEPDMAPPVPGTHFVAPEQPAHRPV